MAYLLILFSDEGIFIFHTNKKKTKRLIAHVGYYIAFWRCVWLTPAIVTVIPLYHLICLSILFLYGWHVYDGSMWFDMKLLFFFSFFLGSRAGHAKIHTSPSYFFLFSLSSFICNFFIYINCF
jgi:hypothetical protein